MIKNSIIDLAALSNKYFEWSHKKQKRFQFKLGIGLMLVFLALVIILAQFNMKLILYLAFPFAIAMTILAPFFDVPSMVKRGKLKYYALFLLAETKINNKIKIHGGTIFDYYFTLPRNLPGQQRTKIILREFLKGILSLTRKNAPDTVVEGTSYILNQRTAQKIGFSRVKTNPIQTFLLCFNYFNLMTALYLSKGKIEFPKIRNIKTYRALAGDIVHNERYIQEMIKRLDG